MFVETLWNMTGKHKAIVVGGGVNAVVDMKISVMPEEEIGFEKAEVTA